MKDISRKEFLKFGATLPFALHSLNLKAATKKNPPPKRIIFICSCLGFYQPYFFPKKRGDLATSRPYLQAISRDHLHDQRRQK